MTGSGAALTLAVGTNVNGNNAFTRAVTGSAGILSTIAGTGPAGYSRDGGPATSAELDFATSTVFHNGELMFVDAYINTLRAFPLGGTIYNVIAGINTPHAVDADDAGNIYWAERGSCVVRVMNASGGVRTLAGTSGTAGYAGDGGPATEALLNRPRGLAYDARTGNIFIADSSNNVVRVVFPDGTIATYAGTGTPGYNGEGVPATAAQLSTPAALAIDDAGNLYVAEGGVEPDTGCRVRRISAPTPTPSPQPTACSADAAVVFAVNADQPPAVFAFNGSEFWQDTGPAASNYTGGGDNPVFSAIVAPYGSRYLYYSEATCVWDVGSAASMLSPDHSGRDAWVALNTSIPCPPGDVVPFLASAELIWINDGVYVQAGSVWCHGGPALEMG